MPECEAEERIMQALFEIEISWGSGKVDLGRIKQILIGRDTVQCPAHVGTAPSKVRENMGI